MVIIDTDVILLAFAFHDDPRQAVNTKFLVHAREHQAGITVYNLMEILGQLSFNLSPKQLDAWQSWLIDAYQLTVVWPVNPDEAMSSISFREEIMNRPFALMRSQRMPFLDALIITLAERTPNVDTFITWNARHYQNKTPLQVFTPKAYLSQSLPK